jgi:hypothetical protein
MNEATVVCSSVSLQQHSSDHHVDLDADAKARDFMSVNGSKIFRYS